MPNKEGVEIMILGYLEELFELSNHHALECFENSKFYGNLFQSYNNFKNKNYVAGVAQMEESLSELQSRVHSCIDANLIKHLESKLDTIIRRTQNPLYLKQIVHKSLVTNAEMVERRLEETAE